MTQWLGLLAGILFGAGLTVSEMIDPAKVLSFLDVAGHWDPSLAFVMGGALAVSAVGTAVARRRSAPLLGGTFDAPPASPIDARLLGGAALFGVGWGLVGFCPGPALAALVTGDPRVGIFVGAMVVGMLAYRLSAARNTVT